MTPQQMSSEIQKGKFRPVYYFYGEEDFRKTEAVRFISQRFLPDDQRLLNSISLTVGKTDFETICTELSAIPMLGERRLLTIGEVQKLSPNQLKKLFTLLTTPAPETVVILSSPAVRTPQKKSAFMREVDRVAETVMFGRLSESTARLKIEGQLKAAGFTFDPEAVNLLNDLTGGDFGGLTGELEKLSLSAESGSHIGVEEVKLIASSYQEFNIFELMDFVLAGETDRALTAYHDLISRGMQPVPIISMLSGHLTKLLLVKQGKKVAGAPFYVNKLKAQAGQFTDDKLSEAISQIANVDRSIRLTPVKPKFLVENLIREISQ